MKVFVCRICGVELTEENWYPSQKSKRNYICKGCNSEKSRKFYQNNKERIKEKSRTYYHENKNDERFQERCRQWRNNNRTNLNKNLREWIEQRRKYLIDELGGKCEICGEENEVVLEFHHKFGRPKNERKTKIYNTNYPIETLQLLCANCHKIVGGV